jgi:hypothetical protein
MKEMYVVPPILAPIRENFLKIQIWHTTHNRFEYPKFPCAWSVNKGTLHDSSVPYLLYHLSHWRDFPANSHVRHYTHRLGTVEVLLGSVDI